MKLPTTAAGRIELLIALLDTGNLSIEDAMELIALSNVPEEVKNSPLWKAMNEKE